MRFDWGSDKNQEIYGHPWAPAYDLSKIVDFPIALFAGDLDELGDLTDVDWLNSVLAPQNSVVFYNTYHLGHMSFMIAKDMSWFTGDGMDVLAKYATNTADSRTEFL